MHPPKFLHSPVSIRSIQSTLKSLYLTPKSPVARRYVHYLMDVTGVSGPDGNI